MPSTGRSTHERSTRRLPGDHPTRPTPRPDPPRRHRRRTARHARCPIGPTRRTIQPQPDVPVAVARQLDRSHRRRHVRRRVLLRAPHRPGVARLVGYRPGARVPDRRLPGIGCGPPWRHQVAGVAGGGARHVGRPPACATPTCPCRPVRRQPVPRRLSATCPAPTCTAPPTCRRRPVRRRPVPPTCPAPTCTAPPTCSGADLSSADLSGANLSAPTCPRQPVAAPTCPAPTCPAPTCPAPTCRGADLYGADLYGADLYGARHNSRTTWPAGFAPTEQAP
jgi:hypothetical protein